MKLKNKMIKQFVINDILRKKNNIYSNYQEHNPNRICYVMTDSTDVIICNEENISTYKDAGFELFGTAESPDTLKELIEKAEMS
jgi:hypothetical protein